MKNNSIYIGVVVVVIILFGVFAWQYYYSNNQNKWVCNNGQWIPQGNPQTSIPTTTCGVEQATSSLNANANQNLTSLVFQPKQCTTEPWQTWYKSGAIKFIQAPTDEQLIKAYYSQKYGVNIISAMRSDTGGVSCQACNACLKNYIYTIEVNSADSAKLVSLGWTDVGQKQ